MKTIKDVGPNEDKKDENNKKKIWHGQRSVSVYTGGGEKAQIHSKVCLLFRRSDM